MQPAVQPGALVESQRVVQSLPDRLVVHLGARGNPHPHAGLLVEAGRLDLEQHRNGLSCRVTPVALMPCGGQRPCAQATSAPLMAGWSAG
jgi:hypothetical protein